MKLINSTKYDDTELKQLLISICKEEGLTPLQIKCMSIAVKNGGGSGTFRRYGYPRIIIRSNKLPRINFVLRHELHHYFQSMTGYVSHKNMLLTNSYYHTHKEVYAIRPIKEKEE